MSRFPNNLDIETGNLLRPEKNIIRLVYQGNSFQNPLNSEILLALSSIDAAIEQIEDDISDAWALGGFPAMGLDSDIVYPTKKFLEDEGRGEGSSGYVTRAEARELIDDLEDAKENVESFREHTNRLSGVNLNTGNYPNIQVLLSVAGSHNRLIETLKNNGQPTRDNFTGVFGSLIDGKSVLRNISTFTSGLSSRLNKNPNRLETESQQLAGYSDSLPAMMYTDNAMYSIYLGRLNLYSLGSSIAGLSQSDQYARYLFDNYNIGKTSLTAKNIRALDRRDEAVPEIQFIPSGAAPISGGGIPGAGGDGGGGEISGSRNEFTLEIPDHDFEVLDAVYSDGSSWHKAQADKAETIGNHLVISVDGDNVTFCSSGRVTVTDHGLTPGFYYFVSDVDAGGLVQVSPAISNPLVFVEDADNIHVLPYRPTEGGTVGGRNQPNQTFPFRFSSPWGPSAIEVPCDGTVIGWSIISDVSDTVEFEFYKSDHVDLGSGTPMSGGGIVKLTGSRSNNSGDVSVWDSTAFSAGEVIEARVVGDNPTTSSNITVQLIIQPS